MTLTTDSTRELVTAACWLCIHGARHDARREVLADAARHEGMADDDAATLAEALASSIESHPDAAALEAALSKSHHLARVTLAAGWRLWKRQDERVRLGTLMSLGADDSTAAAIEVALRLVAPCYMT